LNKPHHIAAAQEPILKVKDAALSEQKSGDTNAVSSQSNEPMKHIKVALQTPFYYSWMVVSVAGLTLQAS
jgi:hypothetical protein